MSFEIYHTPRAKETFKSVYNFIRNQFGSHAADKFAFKTEKIIWLIAENPLMHKASPIDENVRIGLITKQTSIFYRITGTSIHLLFFWDNRQEPVLPN